MEQFPASTSAALVGILIVAVLYATFKVYSNSLSKLPGPWYSKWTGIILKYHWFKGQKAFYIHRLHRQYGPCVRIAPDQVQFNDILAQKMIYNTRETFPKSEWYGNFFTGRVHNIFSTRDTELYRRYRRLLSGAISESSLQNHWDLIKSKADLAISRMGEEVKTRGCTDVSKWMLFMAADIIGELSFGKSFHTLESGEKNPYLKDVEALVPLAAIRTTLPAIIPLGMKLGIPLFVKAGQAAPRIQGHGRRYLEMYDQVRQADSSKVKQTLFTKVFDAGKDGSLTFEEIQSNAQAYIIAGTDTTATTISYLIWAVCNHKSIQRELVDELKTLQDNFQDGDLKKMTVLNNVINETLRLYGAIPSALPRSVPRGGAEIAGHWIPEGTTVATQAYSLHRDSQIWSNPDSFNPSRWNTASKEMHDSFVPFGGGARVCIGVSLARMELRYATARFFLSFPNASISTLEGMSNDDMRPKIWFLQALYYPVVYYPVATLW